MITISKPTVISTFAGGGGSSLGYQMAGFNELLAVEFDKNAIETLKLNFPKLAIWGKDIKDLSVEKCLELAKIKKGQLDILDGSPPCQGFSTAGKRKITDDRNNLFKEFVRLINGLQPKVFIMENVSGMIKGKMKGMFLEILAELKSTNYNVKCKLLNAMWYEVPQSRERVFFIGVRKDLKKDPVFPTKRKKVISVKKAIHEYEGKIKSDSIYCRWARYLKVGQKSNTIKNFPTRERDVFRIYPNKPIPTVTKKSQNQLIHYNEDRPLSYLELSICCSFPKSYKWTTCINEQLGNMVPPKMMYHIAKTIKEKILDNIK